MDELLTFNINDIHEALEYLNDLSIKHFYNNDKELIKKDLENFFKYKTEKQHMYLVLEEGTFRFVTKNISDELSS